MSTMRKPPTFFKEYYQIQGGEQDDLFDEISLDNDVTERKPSDFPSNHVILWPENEENEIGAFFKSFVKPFDIDFSLLSLSMPSPVKITREPILEPREKTTHSLRDETRRPELVIQPFREESSDDVERSIIPCCIF